MHLGCGHVLVSTGRFSSSEISSAWYIVRLIIIPKTVSATKVYGLHASFLKVFTRFFLAHQWNILIHCLKWSRRKGWVRCSYGASEQPAATYGASLMLTPCDNRADTISRHGVIAGGLSADGLLSQAIWRFEVKNFSSHVSRGSDFTPSAI